LFKQNNTQQLCNLLSATINKQPALQSLAYTNVSITCLRSSSHL